MVASLQGLLVGQSRLLEKVDHHVGSWITNIRSDCPTKRIPIFPTCQFPRLVEVDADELSKSGGVVVPDSLGVPPGLQHRVGLDDLVLKGGLSLLPLAGGADGGEVRDDLLGVLSLSGTGLSSDED